MPVTTTSIRTKRARPSFSPSMCKACGRCIDACPKDCIHFGTEINAETGLTPVVLDLEACNACGLCLEACPEPYGLLPEGSLVEESNDALDPADLFGPRQSSGPPTESLPDREVPLPRFEPMVLKGTHASALGAVFAGCRHFFGYPITPSSEGAELLAGLLPALDGHFVQAVSEVAAVNMMYGCGGAGLRTMTFTSSPGFSLMLEGISYMIGAEIPGVFVNIMRGGPGLGNIGPEQADIKLVCRGLGHGQTHAVVLAPSTPQEMLDLTRLAFDLSMKYRNPVILAGDGYLGQITGRVELPEALTEPGLPDWAVWGDEAHRRNLLCSIRLSEPDLEQHNVHLLEKYERMRRAEQRADTYRTDDADWLIVACNTPARMAKGAVEALRASGVRAGLFRPVTLWPFPIDQLLPLYRQAAGVVVVEAGAGQLEDEMRLALSYAIQPYANDYASAGPETPISHLRHYGGVLPQQQEIVSHVLHLEETFHHVN